MFLDSNSVKYINDKKIDYNKISWIPAERHMVFSLFIIFLPSNMTNYLPSPGLILLKEINWYIFVFDECFCADLHWVESNTNTFLYALYNILIFTSEKIPPYCKSIIETV